MNTEPFPSISYSAENERRIERNRAGRSIRQNVWGNWNGYHSKRKVIEFGMREFEAKRWLSGVYL